MDIQTYNVKLNMKDSGVVETGIRLKQGDSAMRFAFTITSGGVAYFSESDVPVVYFKRPDGASVFGSAGTELNNYYYEFKGNELQYAGNVICDVKFTLEDGRESTASFSFEVVPDTVTNNSQGHGVYDNDLAEIIADIEEFEPKLEEAVESAEGYATNAYNSAIDAQGYAQEAAAGSGGNELEYTSNQLKLKRDNVVLSTVTISGGGGGTSDYTDLTNKPSINNVTLSGNKTTEDLGIVAKDIKTDSNESLQKVIDELASFESITYKGTVANYASLPSNASNGDMYYVTADAKHYVCVKDDAISLYEWHDYHSFDDGYMVTVEKVKNDTSTTDSGYVLDARVGKTLADTDANIMGSDAYSSTTTYAIGSCCIYENALYKAIQDNVVGIVPTNSSYWEKVTLESLENSIPPFFDWRNMTRETINLSNSSEWQSYTAQYDGWYQIFNASLSPTVTVSINTAIGCIKNGTTTVLSLIQIPSVKANMQIATPLFYFRKGETIRYIANVSAVTGSQSMKMFIWH